MFDFPPLFALMLHIDLHHSVVIPPIQYTPIKTIRRSGKSVHLQANAIVNSKECVFWRQVPKKDNSQKNREMGAWKINTQENKMDLEDCARKRKREKDGRREREDK